MPNQKYSILIWRSIFHTFYIMKIVPLDSPYSYKSNGISDVMKKNVWNYPGVADSDDGLGFLLEFWWLCQAHCMKASNACSRMVYKSSILLYFLSFFIWVALPSFFFFIQKYSLKPPLILLYLTFTYISSAVVKWSPCTIVRVPDPSEQK